VQRRVLEDEQWQRIAVPTPHESEHRDRDQRGLRQWQQNAPEKAELARPVDGRRVFQLAGDGGEEGPQDHNRNRQSERDLRQDDTEVVVRESEVAQQ
jgi:hypothetical protein